MAFDLSDTASVDTWVALIAAVAGAAIALLGQFAVRVGDRHTHHADLVLEQCSQLVGLAEDFRTRYWEETQISRRDRVDGWDIAAYWLAEARLKILCRDQRLLAALTELGSSGKALGGHWRRGDEPASVMSQRYERTREAIDQFVEASSHYLRVTRRSSI